jgi:phage tail-like protein
MAPRDPYRSFRFEVEVDGFVRAGFSRISGLEHSVEVIEYREGANIDTVHKLPGLSSFADVTFERGVTQDTDFADWVQNLFDFDSVDGSASEEGWRRTIIVYQLDMERTRIKSWEILNAWPRQVSLGDFDATANEVSMETLVVANEGIRQRLLV